MRRFHCPDLPAAGTVRLDGDEARHLIKVLRARPGDAVELFDGEGVSVAATVRTVDRQSVELELGQRVESPRPILDITLVCAIPRGKRMEWLIEKVTEAGVSRILPLVTERGVRDEAGVAVRRRWERAALEACKQCGQARVPRIESPRSVGEAIAATNTLPRLLAAPGAQDDLLSALKSAEPVGQVAVFVGPEGGFSLDEQDALTAAGCRPFHLGALILRIETAAVLAVHRIAWR